MGRRWVWEYQGLRGAFSFGGPDDIATARYSARHPSWLFPCLRPRDAPVVQNATNTEIHKACPFLALLRRDTVVDAEVDTKLLADQFGQGAAVAQV